jgi:integrase/recombinase XerD
MCRMLEVVRIEDGEAGLSVRTTKRPLATIAGLYEYLIIRNDAGGHAIRCVNGQFVVPAGGQVEVPTLRGVPLIRAPRTLPRVIDHHQVDAFTAALRTRRDPAMDEAVLLGGLRRCEVLGLHLEDVRPGEHCLFIADGKGRHQRIIPVSNRALRPLAEYVESELPRTSSAALAAAAKPKKITKRLSGIPETAHIA